MTVAGVRTAPGLSGSARRVRHSSETRSGPELPYRRQYPGGDPRLPGMRRRRRGPRDRRRTGGPYRRPGRRGRSTCTRSRWIEASRRRSPPLCEVTRRSACTSRTSSRRPSKTSSRYPPCARAICPIRWQGLSSSSRCSDCRPCVATASWSSERWRNGWQPRRGPRPTASFRCGSSCTRGSCERALSPRTIFYPQPHVDSSLLVLDRRPREELPSIDPERLRAVVQAAFGQRRKTLANALSAGLGLPRQLVLDTIHESRPTCKRARGAAVARAVRCAGRPARAAEQLTRSMDAEECAGARATPTSGDAAVQVRLEARRAV